MTKDWYLNVYNSIILRAKAHRELDYKEMHHIVPTCVGGTDDSGNIVDLTAREHFLCHWLLTKIYRDHPAPILMKLSSAFNKMCCFSASNDGRRMNSHLFEYARKVYSINHPSKLPEVKLKISKSLSKYYKNKREENPRIMETRVCECGCNETFECEVSSTKRYILYHHTTKGKPYVTRDKALETRVCECGCNETFECEVSSTKRYILYHHTINPGYRTEEQNKNTSEKMKKNLAAMTPEELSQRSKNSWGSSDPVARGKKISATKKGKSTNQAEIEGRRYAAMSDEEFHEHIKDRAKNVQSRMTTYRNRYKDE